MSKAELLIRLCKFVFERQLEERLAVLMENENENGTIVITSIMGRNLVCSCSNAGLQLENGIWLARGDSKG